ncbi:hypothetical protein JW887_02225 [Candidatus Dojkabacteria bacterium]|nr:hypothetical protein [Candidatus Dojkabacteria bacterium]
MRVYTKLFLAMFMAFGLVLFFPKNVLAAPDDVIEVSAPQPSGSGSLYLSGQSFVAQASTEDVVVRMYSLFAPFQEMYLVNGQSYDYASGVQGQNCRTTVNGGYTQIECIFEDFNIVSGSTYSILVRRSDGSEFGLYYSATPYALGQALFDNIWHPTTDFAFLVFEATPEIGVYEDTTALTNGQLVSSTSTSLTPFSFTVRNDGHLPLEINPNNILGDFYVYGPGTGIYTLDPLESVNLVMGVNATGPGNYTGGVAIFSDDDDVADQIFSLDLEVTLEREYQIEFNVQPVDTQVSNTMAPIQVRVMDQFDTLLDEADTYVTLNLVGGDGQIVGTLTRPVVDGVATFSDLAVNTVGTYQLNAVLSGSSYTVSAELSQAFDIYDLLADTGASVVLGVMSGLGLMGAVLVVRPKKQA